MKLVGNGRIGHVPGECSFVFCTREATTTILGGSGVTPLALCEQHVPFVHKQLQLRKREQHSRLARQNQQKRRSRGRVDALAFTR